MIKVIGHRGACSLAPENTWASFDLAVQMGVDAIETDIWATADGELILIHDQDLARTTNGTGLVTENLWSEIASLDAGSWFAADFIGASIPRLQNTLIHYRQQVDWVLEIKQKGIEIQVLRMVQELNLTDSVTFTSFDQDVVENMRNASREVVVEWLLTESNPQKQKQALAMKVNHVCLPATIISAEIVASWNSIGLPVRVWQVTDKKIMKKAFEAGVVAMTLDFPHLLLDFLQKKEEEKS